MIVVSTVLFIQNYAVKKCEEEFHVLLVPLSVSGLTLTIRKEGKFFSVRMAYREKQPRFCSTTSYL